MKWYVLVLPVLAFALSFSLASAALTDTQTAQGIINAVSDKDLGAWVRKSTPPMRRVVFGYQVLVDNCADPDLDYLEFNPRIKAALEAAPATVAAAGTTAAPKEDACKTGAGS